MFEYLMPHAGDAELRRTRCSTRPARRAVAAPDRVRPPARRALGHLGVRLQRRPTRALNYQYRAFGVPGLGLKRGLAEDLVVAPYATMMALMVAPEAGLREPAAPGGRRRGRPLRHVRGGRLHRRRACRAARRARWSARSWRTTRAWACSPSPTCCSTGRCSGASRPTRGSRRPCCCCRSACRASAVFQPARDERAGRRSRGRRRRDADLRVSPTRTRRRPAVQLLSNGRYHVMLTSAGGGYSRWQRPRGHALARGRDARRLGQLLLPARRRQRRVLVGRAPADAACRASSYEAIFSDGRGRVPRAATHGIDTHTEIVVSPEDDIELRRLRITNNSRAPPHDRGHQLRRGRARARRSPTRCIRPSASCSCRPRSSRDRQAVLCTRRPRVARRAAAVDVPPDGGARIAVPAPDRQVSAISLRDRPRALPRPRQHAAQSPQALAAPARCRTPPARCSTRSSAIRCRITLAPDQAVTVDIVYRHGATSREACAALAEKYQRPPPRRPRVRPGLDPQPGGAAPAQRQRGRCAALRAARRRCDLRAAGAARRRERAGAQPARPVRAVGLCDLGRPADRAGADRRAPTTSSWCASWCRRTPSGA